MPSAVTYSNGFAEGSGPTSLGRSKGEVSAWAAAICARMSGSEMAIANKRLIDDLAQKPGPLPVRFYHTYMSKTPRPLRNYAYRANVVFKNFTPLTAISWLEGSICRQMAAARAITF